jgi:hypothetical protein
MIKIYEDSDANQSNIYNRYLYIVDPYKIPRKTHFRGKCYEKENPTIIIHRMEQIIPSNYDTTLEFKITNSFILEQLKNTKGEFLLDRYIVEWKSKKYFLKRYNAIIYKIEGDIVVLFSKMYDMVNEVLIDREIKLNLLLTYIGQLKQYN